jgi:hypothetical protein
MDKLVNDYETRKQKQESRQGHCGRKVSHPRNEKPERGHYCTDRQCEKICEPRRRLAQRPPRRVTHEVWRTGYGSKMNAHVQCAPCGRLTGIRPPKITSIAEVGAVQKSLPTGRSVAEEWRGATG